jgi:hypothetical protein
MSDRRETHAWFDGEWHVYTERPADARRFEKWLGKPDPGYGKGGGPRQVWWWRSRPANSLTIRKRRVGSGRPPSPAALAGLAKSRALRNVRVSEKGGAAQGRGSK